MQLDQIVMGYPGAVQDHWHFCSRCTGVFYGGAASVCAAGGAHDTLSEDYVLHAGAPAAPAGTQSRWRWCRKCGGLHFGEGASRCAAGDAHDSTGSGNYFLAMTPEPDEDDRGISTAQKNWPWCSACGGLFFNQSGSRCPAGGTHRAEGAEYWMSYLGGWPPP